MDDKVTRMVRAAPRGDDDLFTRRQYMTMRVCLAGASIWEAIESVSSVAIEHPEWDLEEERTWAEWSSNE